MAETCSCVCPDCRDDMHCNGCYCHKDRQEATT